MPSTFAVPSSLQVRHTPEPIRDSTSEDRVTKIFYIAVIGLVVVPLVVGIYESWRKKQITYSHNQGFIQSFNPLNLWILGWRVIASSHSSSSLETMPITEIRKINWKNLWPHQLDILANRAEFVAGLSDEELVELYRKIDGKAEFLTCLSGSQLVALLKNKSLAFEEKKEISQSISGRQIDSVDLLEPICTLHTMSINTDLYIYRRGLSISQRRHEYHLSWSKREEFERKIDETVNQIKTPFKSIPNNVVVTYFQKFGLDPFHLLYFSADQIQLIDFASVVFYTTQFEVEDASVALNRTHATPLNWFLQGCDLGNGELSTCLSKDKDSDPLIKLKIPSARFSHSSLSVKQVAFLALRTAKSDHGTLRQIFSDQKYDECFTKQAEFVEQSQLLEVYRNIDETNRPEFIKHLTSRQLLALLDDKHTRFDEKFEISKLISGKQIDHVEILAHLCGIYTLVTNFNFGPIRESIVDALIIPNVATEISEIQARYKSIPKVLVRFYFQKNGLDPFNLLFFSADQIRAVDFKRIDFRSFKVKLEESGLISSSQGITPLQWLVQVYNLGRGFDENNKPEAPSIPAAIAQLNTLTVKQVAFLVRRMGMAGVTHESLEQVLRAVFPNQATHKDFLKYQKEFADSNEIEVSLPDLTISEACAVLGLKHEASLEEINKQYKKKSLQLHPDKAGRDNKEAAEQFKKVSEAYKFLTLMLEAK